MKSEELHYAIHYLPHDAQSAFHESSARFKVLIAGARFGKSLAAARDVLPELLAEDTRGWLVAPTFALARAEFRYMGGDMAGLGSFRVNETIEEFRAPWGAEARCMSAHIPHSLLGEEIDWLILCEAAQMSREAFERYLRARLTTRNGRLVVPTTPHGHNWIHGLYQRGLSQPGWESFRFATWDNPLVSRDEIESARASLPTETFNEQYGGEFTTPAGRVYPEFQRSTHVAQCVTIPGALVVKGIDFGFRNPFACLWATLDHDDRLLVLREHFRQGLSLDVHATAIQEIDETFRSEGCAIGAAYADPSGAMERGTLQAAGIQTKPGDNRIAGGIDCVRRLLKIREDGRPGLIVADSCRNLIREFESYRWNESPNLGNPAPHKSDDHALDALRYLCVGISRQPGWHDRGLSW